MKSYAFTVGLLFVSMGMVQGACPPADVTGDCVVDMEDLAVVACFWLEIGEPEPAGMTWVAITEPNGFVGQFSKYETTNAQYCEYLNDALATGDIIVDADGQVLGAAGSNAGEDFAGRLYFSTRAADAGSQILYQNESFFVRTRDGRSMVNHPVVCVSWYGATAFCAYYGYRLPGEAEWQAVADFDGSYGYGCGPTIDSSLANYNSINPLGLTDPPYTTPVGWYPAFGYGVCDMAGNAFEWTSDCYYSDCRWGYRSIRGGGWNHDSSFCESSFCEIEYRYKHYPRSAFSMYGFRVCR